MASPPVVQEEAILHPIDFDVDAVVPSVEAKVKVEEPPALAHAVDFTRAYGQPG